MYLTDNLLKRIEDKAIASGRLKKGESFSVLKVTLDSYNGAVFFVVPDNGAKVMQVRLAIK